MRGHMKDRASTSCHICEWGQDGPSLLTDLVECRCRVGLSKSAKDLLGKPQNCEKIINWYSKPLSFELVWANANSNSCTTYLIKTHTHFGILVEIALNFKIWFWKVWHFTIKFFFHVFFHFSNYLCDHDLNIH